MALLGISELAKAGLAPTIKSKLASSKVFRNLFGMITNEELLGLFRKPVVDITLETELHLKLEKDSVWKILCPWYVWTNETVTTKLEDFKKTITSHVDLLNFDVFRKHAIGKSVHAFHDSYSRPIIFPNTGISNFLLARSDENQGPGFVIENALPMIYILLLPTCEDINWILETPEITLTCRQVNRESILEVLPSK